MALVSTSIKADDIITLMTSEGELIAKFVSESDSVIQVKSPLQVTGTSSVADTGQTKALWGKISTTSSSTDVVDLNSNNILCVLLTDEAIATQYSTEVS